MSSSLSGYDLKTVEGGASTEYAMGAVGDAAVTNNGNRVSLSLYWISRDCSVVRARGFITGSKMLVCVQMEKAKAGTRPMVMVLTCLGLALHGYNSTPWHPTSTCPSSPSNVGRPLQHSALPPLHLHGPIATACLCTIPVLRRTAPPVALCPGHPSER